MRISPVISPVVVSVLSVLHASLVVLQRIGAAIIVPRNILSARSVSPGRTEAAAPTSPPRTLQPEWSPEQELRTPRPFVDDDLVGQWEQEGPVPPPALTFTDDIEDVTLVDNNGHDWGAWPSASPSSLPSYSIIDYSGCCLPSVQVGVAVLQWPHVVLDCCTTQL